MDSNGLDLSTWTITDVDTIERLVFTGGLTDGVRERGKGGGDLAS